VKKLENAVEGHAEFAQRARDAVVALRDV
jgi:hypothetical protein